MSDITPARLQKVLQQLKNQSPLAGVSKTEQIKNSLKDDTKNASFECRPWDYSIFLRRVRTYQVMTWFAKPKKINPFACARFGWINCDFDMLECPSCKQRLLFSPAKLLTQQGLEEAAAAFLTQLETSHSEYCPWRNNPSPSHFTHLPHDQSKVLEHFSDRFKTFQAVPLPALSAQGEERIKALIDDKLDLLVDDREHKDAVKTAFILAVCGWQCMQEQEQHTIYCSQCQRQVALKQCTELLEHKIDENDVNITVRLLKESQLSDGDAQVSSPTQSPHSRKRDREQVEGDKDTEQGPSKRARTESPDTTSEGHDRTTAIETSGAQDGTSATLQHTASPYNSPTATVVRDKPFDPVHEHRYFCPWINSYEESAQTSSLVAWQKGLIALFSLPASPADQVSSAPKSFSDFQAILNRVRAVVQTPNKKCK
jgi:uncharacterized protein YbaR (Trm112 family)